MNTEKIYKKQLMKYRNPYDAILSMKSNMSVDNLSNLYFSLKKIRNLSIYLEGRVFPSKYEDLNWSIKNHFFDLEKEMVWLSCIIKYYSKEINLFIKLREQYNNLIFNSQWQEAITVLEDIEKELGLSIWLIENKMKIYQKLGGLTAQKKYVQEILGNDSISEIIKVIFSFKSMEIEESVSTEKFELELKQYLDDLFEGNPDAVGKSYLSNKLSFLDKNHTNELFKLNMDKFLPLIDRYIEFIKIIFSTVEKEELNIEVLKIILNNMEKIEDIEFKKLFRNLINLRPSSTDIEALKILDDYSLGKYEKVKLKCEEFFLYNSSYVELYEIYVKSCIYLNVDISLDSKTLQGSILSNLYKFHVNKSNTSLKIQPLLKICYEYSTEYWTWKLFLITLQSIDFTETVLNYQLSRIGARLSLLVKPHILSKVYTKGDALNLLNSLKHDFETSPTLALHKVFINNELEGIKRLNLPKEREFKFLGMINFSNNNYSDATRYYESLIQETESTNRFELNSLLVKCYINTLTFNKAIKIIAEHYLNNIHIISDDAFKNIINLLDSHSYRKEKIDVPIMYYYYSKNISNDKDYLLTDIYEDFLYEHNFLKPTQLYEIKDKFDSKKFIFFLKNICSIEIMSKSVEFVNHSEVEKERIQICTMLKELDSSNENQYDEEIQEITKKMTLKKVTRVVDSNKIYVDEFGIKKTLMKILSEDFSRFVNLDNLNSVDNKATIIYLSGFNESKKVAIVVNEKWGLFISLITNIRDEFVYSKQYGLNGYLSVGIRHGSLVGQLRRELEKAKIITQIDSESNTYNENTYWLEKIGCEDKDKNAIQEKLDIFSQSYDSKIFELKDEYIQIKTEENLNSKGLFDYCLNESILRTLYMEVVQSKDLTLESFIDYVIGHLWDITERNLNIIRSYLESKFKAEINSYFEELLYNLDFFASQFNLEDLNSKIKDVKIRTNRDIDIMISWFTRNKNLETESFNLHLPIDIAFQASKNMNSNILKSNIQSNDVALTFKGRYLNSFVHLFTILFDNAMKRSGLTEINIIVESSVEDGYLMLKVVNELDFEKIDLKTRMKNIHEAKEKLTIENQDLISTEGGSGLPKLSKLIKIDLESSGEMDFNIYDKKFQVDIKLELERLLI